MNVLISGAAGGIGSSIAKKFIEEGFEVYSLDLVSKDLGKHFHNLCGDVTNVKELENIKEKLNGVKFAHIITLAGRALQNEWKPFDSIDYQTIHGSIELNLVGHLNVIRMFMDDLLGEKKSIVTISSINALGGFGLPIYSAAKAGLIGFTHALAPELTPKGIRINTVAPGTIITEATEKEPKDFEELLKTTDHGRFATKEEVAELVFNLCEKSNETNEIKIIDEGQSRRVRK